MVYNGKSHCNRWFRGYPYFRKLPYSNVKMKADERHLKQFKVMQNDRKKLKNAKTEAV